MSRYRGPRFKRRIRRLSVWGPGLTSKRPKTGNDLHNRVMLAGNKGKDPGVGQVYNYLKFG